MKKLKQLILMASLITSLVSAETFNSPDILVDSKLDFDWSGVLIHKARRLMSNYKMFDPFTNKIPEPVVVSDSLFHTLLPAESHELMNDLGNVIGLDVLKGKTKITIHGLMYDIQGFKADLKGSENLKDGVVITSDFSANQLNLTADKVVLALEVPGKNGKNLPLIQIEILNTVVKAHGDNITKFFARVKLEEKKNTFKLNILKSDFDHMSDELIRDPSQISIEIGSIVVPAISIKAGSKHVDFSPEKIERLIRSKEDGIKGILIAQFAGLLKKGVGETILKAIEKNEFQKEYWLDSNIIKSQIKLSQFTSNAERNNLQIRLPGDFCTKEKFDVLLDDCLNNKVTQASKSRIGKTLHEDSVVHMKSLIDNGDANIVASISEDYINKLLVATYDAGMWKTMLDEADVELGPNKVFIRLDEVGDSGTLFMDVKYKFTKFQGFLLGKQGINFPLVMKVAMRIEKHAGIPIIIIQLKDVDLSDKTLLNGRPDVGLSSNIKDVPRLKKKVLAALRAKLGDMKNKDIIDLRYPELKGLSLETVQFISDGKGRMNATMKLENLVNDHD